MIKNGLLKVIKIIFKEKKKISVVSILKDSVILITKKYASNKVLKNLERKKMEKV